MKYRFFIFVLIAISIIGKLIIASKVPFLHIWDEQFHALVAKNLVNDPLNPTLFPDIEEITNNFNWNYANIWLHKQPFFLWLIALSIKLFGPTALAIRIPSIIISSLSLFAGYRIGTILSSRKTGLILSLLLVTSFVFNDVALGHQTTDHNDAIFISLVLISFWLFSEYWFNNFKKGIYFIGIVVGLAVLTKWLVGLLVFLPWGIMIIHEGINLRHFRDYIIALTIASLVFLPWQFYCYQNFPLEYLHELELNKLHFISVIEGHDGTWDYYLRNLRHQYFKFDYPFGPIIWFILLLFFIFKEKDSHKRLFLGVPIFAIFLFFSFAKTKMPLFTFSVFFLMYYVVAYSISSSYFYLKIYLSRLISKSVIVLFVLFIALQNLRIQEFRNIHFFKEKDGQHYYFNRMNRTYQNIQEINKLNICKKSGIIFNAPKHHHVAFSFFSDIPTFDFMPSSDIIHNLVKKGYQPYVYFEAFEYESSTFTNVEFKKHHTLPNGALLTTPINRE